jgi:hypothetical protein
MAQALEGLLFIPRALGAEVVHDGKQTVKRQKLFNAGGGEVGEGCLYHKNVYASSQ